MVKKSEHREMQELVRELLLIRHNNLKVGLKDATERKDEKLIEQQLKLLNEMPGLLGQSEFLLLAEGQMICTVLERWLRIELERTGEENKNFTLSNLLEEAIGKRRGFLLTPINVEKITLIRNTLVHGNYEQLAIKHGLKSVEAFFKEKYTPILEDLVQLVNKLMAERPPD